MKYHNITKNDMLNGDGLRVVLWVAGCSHHCEGCHNPTTWDPNGGIPFDDVAKQEIFEELEHSYVSGITFSGGDPMNEANIDGVIELAKEIKEKYPNKTLWVYSGYKITEIFNASATKKPKSNEFIAGKAIKGMEKRAALLKLCDVFVDGRFEKALADENYPWAGSTNQNVLYREGCVFTRNSKM